MSGREHEAITPELVLVDPVLRERLCRESLTPTVAPSVDEARVLHGGILRLIGPVALPIDVAAPSRAPLSRPSSRWSWSSIGAAVLTALFLALPSLAFLPPRQAPVLASEAAAPGPLPMIAWQPDPSADYYVFELSDGKNVVMVEPVRVPSVTVRSGLRPGRYAWRAFVVDGDVATPRRSAPIAAGTVTLD